MRVTLIYPLLSRKRAVLDENKQYWPPLGLAYIAAVLEKEGHNVQIIDRDVLLRKSKLDFEKTDDITLELIKSFNPSIVGFSATTPNVSDSNYFSEKIKRQFPGILTVIGGPHCVGEPKLTLEVCKHLDVLVSGEGEMVMLDLANNKPFPEITGISYRNNKREIILNPPRKLISDIDSLPYPARHLLDMSYYTIPSRFIGRNLNLRTTHVFTARGCPYACNYCAGPISGQGKVRFHSPQRVIAEILDIVNKYNIEAIYFAEDMFLSSKKRAREIIDILNEHKLNKQIVWMAQINAKVVDEDLLKMLKYAGCVQVEYGFESGSQRILDLMNKNNIIEKNKKAAMLTRKVGIRFQGNFIVGYPQETEDDFMKTLNFIKETKPTNVALNVFMPLPGTPVYHRLKSEGKKIPPWDGIGDQDTPMINYTGMSDEKFEELYLNARLKIILPLNLYNFLSDNIKNPYRLAFILITQFKGVLIKSIRLIVKLAFLKK